MTTPKDEGSKQNLKSSGCEVSVVGESASQTGAPHQEKGKMIDQPGRSRFPSRELRPCVQPFLTCGRENGVFRPQCVMKLDDCRP